LKLLNSDFIKSELVDLETMYPDMPKLSLNLEKIHANFLVLNKFYS